MIFRRLCQMRKLHQQNIFFFSIQLWMWSEINRRLCATWRNLERWERRAGRCLRKLGQGCHLQKTKNTKDKRHCQCPRKLGPGWHFEQMIWDFFYSVNSNQVSKRLNPFLPPRLGSSVELIDLRGDFDTFVMLTKTGNPLPQEHAFIESTGSGARSDIISRTSHTYHMSPVTSHISRKTSPGATPCPRSMLLLSQLEVEPG